jgi:hypothetical protein
VLHGPWVLGVATPSRIAERFGLDPAVVHGLLRDHAEFLERIDGYADRYGAALRGSMPGTGAGWTPRTSRTIRATPADVDRARRALTPTGP